MTRWDHNEESVNVGELREALRKHVTSTSPVAFGGYFNFENLITEAAEAIQRERGRYGKLVTTDDEPPVRMDETVTVAELIAAFQRRGYADFTSPLHVTTLVNDIKANREPEWRYGDVVKDRLGVLWRRESPGTHPWSQFGTQARYRHESPVRPLKKVEF